MVRGGGGIYYDRFGSGPLLDLERYKNARRRSVQISLDPASLPETGCVPITNCTAIIDQPANLARLAPNAKVPYQIQYGLSIERQLGEKATGVISAYSMRGIDEFRSVDVNAPAESAKCSRRASSRAAGSTCPTAGGSTNTSPASGATPGLTMNRTPEA